MANIYNGGRSFGGFATGVATDVAINDIIGFDITNGDNKTVQTILEMMAVRIIALEKMLGLDTDSSVWEGEGKGTAALETWLYNTFHEKQPRFAIITLRNPQVALEVSGELNMAGDMNCVVMSDTDSSYTMIMQPSNPDVNGVLVGKFSVLSPSNVGLVVFPVQTGDYNVADDQTETIE